MRFFLEKIFIDSSLDNRNFHRVFLALSEAVNNSITHGNRLDVTKRVFVRIFHDDINLFIEVKDEGAGFSFECIEDPTSNENIKKEKGRGIFLIRQVSDEVEYFEEGRKVLIRFNIIS